jgi:release factor glutamine methyltransferase
MWLLQEITGCSSVDLYAEPHVEVDHDDVVAFERAIARRAGGEPLQHILGYTEFYGLTIHVSPDVLIPRPETERVVEYAVEAMGDTADPAILDAGTGSGCIALALKHGRPDAQVTACDISEAALDVARANAAALDLNINVEPGDMMDSAFPHLAGGPFDLVISNPPYIPDAEADTLSATVRDYDPGLALFSGEDALKFYRALAQHAPEMLKPGGRLIVETHADFAEGVADVMKAAGLVHVDVQPDLSGRPRIVDGTWLRTSA